MPGHSYHVRDFHFMEQLTKELVVASLIEDATRHNVSQLIETGKNIKISRDTISVNYAFLSKMRDLYLYFKDRMDAENKGDKDRIKARKEGYDTYMKPIEEILEKAEPFFIQVNGEIKREEAIAIQAIEKQNEIKSRHVEFVNDIARLIAMAPDNTELARIQQLIGSEKSRTGFYGDYHPKIKDVCDSLLSLVSDRKQIIKDNAKLQKEYDKFISSGDIVKATQIKEQMDHSVRVIGENVMAIAENAYKQVAAVSLADTELVSAAVSPRLHRWSWRVEDIELLYKNLPALVVKEPHAKSINLFLKEMQESGKLKETEDNNFYGLILYRKPFFVAIKTKDDAS